MEQFGLQYIDQAQGILGSLVSMPSLLSRVIGSQRLTQRYCPSGTWYSQVQVTKAGPFTQMVVFGIGDGLGFPSQQI